MPLPHLISLRFAPVNLVAQIELSAIGCSSFLKCSVLELFAQYDAAVLDPCGQGILPSERARAYKLRVDAIKRKAGRPTKEQENNSPNYSADFRSDDSVGQAEGISGDTVRNYISLLNLSPPLLEMVDNGTIALTPAYQLTHLAPDEQEMLLTAMDSEQATPSVSQAQRIRKLSQSGKLNEDSMLQIMMEQKKPERHDITLSGEKLRKYFPRSYSPQRIEETIFKLLDAWMRKRQRDNSR